MDATAGKVILKLSSTFASMLHVKDSSLVSVEYTVNNGATIGSVLKELVNNYPLLKAYLFNPDGTEVNERIDVVLNSTLVKGKNIAGTCVKDGDTIYLLPVYEGG